MPSASRARARTRLVAAAQFLLGLGLLWALLSVWQQGQKLIVYWGGGEQARISLYDRSGWPESVQLAVRHWNSSGLRVRFELVRDPRKADLEIRPVDRFESAGCKGRYVRGCATIGYNRSWPGNPAGRVELLRRPAKQPDRGQYADVMAHELGHVLGLRHSSARCALMNNERRCPREDTLDATLKQPDCPFERDGLEAERDRCERASLITNLCGPTQHEIKQLAPVYGRRAAADYSPYCRRAEPRPWEEWCVFPAYRPPGYGQPSFLTFYKGRWRCGPQTPARFLAVRAEMDRSLATSEQLARTWYKEAHQYAPTAYDGFLLTGVSRRYGRHTPAQARQRLEKQAQEQARRYLEAARLELRSVVRLREQLSTTRPVSRFACGSSPQCQRRIELAELRSHPEQARVFRSMAASRGDATTLLLAQQVIAAQQRSSGAVAYRFARWLSSQLGARPAGSRAANQGLARMRDAFERARLRLAYDRYSVRGRSSHNLIGIRDTPRSCLTILIAHADTVPNTPGALDNASGAGMLVGLAGRLRQLPLRCDTWLVATGSEERGYSRTSYHIGAEALAQRVARMGRAKDLRLVLSLDELGRGRRLLLRSSAASPRTTVETPVLRAARAADLRASWARDDGQGNSDHREFQLRGWPAAKLGLPDNRCRHLPCDTPSLLQQTSFLRTARALERLLSLPERKASPPAGASRGPSQRADPPQPPPMPLTLRLVRRVWQLLD